MSGLIASVGRYWESAGSTASSASDRIVHDEQVTLTTASAPKRTWGGRAFTLVDHRRHRTPAREQATDVLMKAALAQVQLAIEAASVLASRQCAGGVVPAGSGSALRRRKYASPSSSPRTRWIHYAPKLPRSEFVELTVSRKFFRGSAPIHGRSKKA